MGVYQVLTSLSLSGTQYELSTLLGHPSTQEHASLECRYNVSLFFKRLRLETKFAASRLLPASPEAINMNVPAIRLVPVRVLAADGPNRRVSGIVANRTCVTLRRFGAQSIRQRTPKCDPAPPAMSAQHRHALLGGLLPCEADNFSCSSLAMSHHTRLLPCRS